MNGREWSGRSLEREGIDFLAKGNKFLYLADYEEAQSMLDSQLDARWAETPDGFLPTVFPIMGEILGPRLSYYWTMWQSEWATDLIFDSPDSLNPIMDLYNEQNNLRVETTINKPGKFRVYRHKQGQSTAEEKTLLPIKCFFSRIH